ncbi:hypothetical protein [Streptomyces virginiae]|uniref:hypothetical protein n=1 Tax=Streptomyces virginiae TaxID=1961 RepID=UPI00342DE1F4
MTAAFNALDVTVEDLPAYTPHLKATVEGGLNRAVEPMFLVALPGYDRRPRPGRCRARPKDEVLLDFEDFTTRLLDVAHRFGADSAVVPGTLLRDYADEIDGVHVIYLIDRCGSRRCASPEPVSPRPAARAPSSAPRHPGP